MTNIVIKNWKENLRHQEGDLVVDRLVVDLLLEALLQEVLIQSLDSPTLHIDILLLHIAIFQFIMELMEGICSF